MKNLGHILLIVNMVIMVILIIMITLQNKSSGLSNIFGGAGTVVHARRGFEKWLFYATIVFGFLFIGLSVAALYLSK